MRRDSLKHTSHVPFSFKGKFRKVFQFSYCFPVKHIFPSKHTYRVPTVLLKKKDVLRKIGGTFKERRVRSLFESPAYRISLGSAHFGKQCWKTPKHNLLL